HEGAVRLLEGLRYRHVTGRRVEGRRVPVAGGERVGDRPQREPVDLGQHVARGLLVNLGERPGPEDLLAAEYLEQVELDIPQIALVVAHVTPRVRLAPSPMLLTSSNLGRRRRVNFSLPRVYTPASVRYGGCTASSSSTLG